VIKAVAHTKVFGGRLDLNLARTTPLLPVVVLAKSMVGYRKKVHTVWSGDLAPDNPDLGAPDGALSPVDVGYALTGIPLRSCGVVDALELEQRSSGVGVALSSLVGNVLSPKSSCVSQLFHTRYCMCVAP
jgi:hypothetical protein